MSATGQTQREALENAWILCTLAEMVEHHQLDTQGFESTIRVFRETAPRELPFIMLQTAKTARSLRLDPADLVAWLRDEGDQIVERS